MVGSSGAIALRVGLSTFPSVVKFRGSPVWRGWSRDLRRMDCARSIAALRDFICGRFFSEQSVVAAVMVHDWSRRWVDCISRFAPESDGRADDLLATGGSLCQPNVFCNVLLSRECRSLLESGLAINCRSCSTRLHHAMSSCHARNVDQRFCSYRQRGSGQYVAHGPVDRAFVGHCDLLAIWA